MPCFRVICGQEALLPTLCQRPPSSRRSPLVLGQSNQSPARRFHDPLAAGEIQSTLRAKLTESVGFCENSMFSSAFQSVEGSGRPVGGSPNRWRPAGQSYSARPVPNGSIRVRPASGFPRSTGFQPVPVHRGGFASPGYLRVRIKAPSSSRLAKPMSSYQTICSIARFGCSPVSIRISKQTIASGI